MKRKLNLSGRFALTGIAAAALCFTAPAAWSLGLGRLSVQSSLGETMLAEIEVTSLSAEEQSNLRIRIAPPEAYRAAGVDYNPVLTGARASLQRRPDGRTFIRVTSDRGVQEPFVDVILEISWATGRLVREYTLLFDPPAAVRAQAPQPQAPQTSPVITAQPPAPSVVPPATSTAASRAAERQAQREAERQAARERREAERAARATTPADAPSRSTGSTGSTGNSADEYRVQAGDSLSRVASRVQRPGVSLDQMLVALFRANPSAFVGENMNRLKAGVVLSVPSAESAQAVTPTEARRTIVAQSSDFGAYRQRLAGAAATSSRETPAARAATGKVEANVADRAAAPAPAPDRLTVSRGGASEQQLARDRERQANEQRVAELNRNLQDLRRMQGAASAPVATPSPATPTTGARPGTPAAPTAAPAPAPAVVPTPTLPGARPATPAPAPAPATVPAPAPAPVPAPAPAPTPAPAPAPAVAASVPAVVTPPVVASASAAASAPATATATPAASAPVVAAAPASAASRAAARPASAPVVRPAPRPEPSLLDEFLENPLYWGIAALLGLLALFGIYRYTQRSRKDSGETSFLESRLQPDSFFGASGGQRIDTRDAAGTSSSMSYSLSQLDAIGDVDPVAEADVYLAYGRDLQAEEILKEAMRSNPERLAIRAKLLEVYAKRRDIKGFELLATQLFSLTRGEGEEWAKTQELGAQIDPENPLYRAGGAPQAAEPAAPSFEPLGASTLPASVVPVPSAYGLMPDSQVTDSQFTEVDLDLDNPDVGTPSQPAAFDATQSVPPHIGVSSSSSSQSQSQESFSQTHKMPLSSSAPAPAAPDDRDQPLAFDLSGISLDLDKTQPPPIADAIETPFLDDVAGQDPLLRKLELAEEFQRIGDKDGARDLLREVLATASGATKAKAQAMLEDLG